MTQVLIRLLANAIALAAATWIVGGIEIDTPTTNRYLLTLVIVAAIFGVINTVLKPIVQLLSLPLFILTLGLFTLVVNGLMLWLASGIAGLLDVPFHVDGFWASVWGALIISIVSLILNLILPEESEAKKAVRR